MELHRHLEGAIRVQTILDVAGEAGVDLSCESLEELREKALILKPMQNLKEVLDKFWLFQSVLANPSIISRVAYENCIDAYHDGIRVLELRYSPSFINHNHPELNYDVIHEAIVGGVKKATHELGGKIAVGLICIITRDQPLAEADRTADFAINHRKSFVGFDLAGEEVGFKSSQFVNYFERVKKAGLRITVHSGEEAVAEAPQFVKESIELLGAERIGHGLQIIHDKKVIDFVKSRNVVLELCPSSNVITNAVKDLKSHPIKRLMDLGVRVTLNSDDPHIFGIDLTNEYEVLEQELGFTERDFETLTKEALEATFVNSNVVQSAWEK